MKSVPLRGSGLVKSSETHALPRDGTDLSLKIWRVEADYGRFPARPVGNQMHSPNEITKLLIAWSDGDEAALNELTPLVYEELHRLAHHYMGNERPNHTLQTSALVNEAYVRLINWKNVRWKNRAHFFGVSAQLMRRILVDFARSKKNAKRGAQVISLSNARLLATEKGADIVAIDAALVSLAKLDERQGRVVELRFFGGLTLEQVAEVLNVSLGTVRRDWAMARAWLRRELHNGN